MEAWNAATESGGSSSAHARYVSAWCPECGRRRRGGPGARCANCDPWWTSPFVHVGVPVALATLFLFTTITAELRAQSDRAAAAAARRQVATRIPVRRAVPAYRPPVVVAAPPVSVWTTGVPLTARPAAAPVAAPDPWRQRQLTVERAMREAAFADSMAAAQDAARAQRTFAFRSRALAVMLAQERLRESPQPGLGSAAGSGGVSYNGSVAAQRSVTVEGGAIYAQ